MSESEFLTVLAVMARENDMLRFRIERLEKENEQLRNTTNIHIKINKETVSDG